MTNELLEWYARQDDIYVRVLPGCPMPMVTPCSDGGWNVAIPCSTREGELTALLEELKHIRDKDHEKKDVQKIELTHK